MYFIEERIKRTVDELGRYRYVDTERIEVYRMKQASFTGGERPDDDTGAWEVFLPASRWGGRDRTCWFSTEIRIPARFEGKTVVYKVSTGREGEWSTLNPQFLVFVNGAAMQGLDTNHTEVILSENALAGEIYRIDLKAHSGMKDGTVELNSWITTLDREVETLYYNIKVPLEVAERLNKEDKRRVDILNS